jgi:hypothetical protein
VDGASSRIYIPWHQDSPIRVTTQEPDNCIGEQIEIHNSDLFPTCGIYLVRPTSNIDMHAGNCRIQKEYQESIKRQRLDVSKIWRLGFGNPQIESRVLAGSPKCKCHSCIRDEALVMVKSEPSSCSLQPQTELTSSGTHVGSLMYSWKKVSQIPARVHVLHSSQ